MKPLIVHSHSRPVTQIKYNRKGDLLFSVGKDGVAAACFADNGERLGSYDGHSGTLWCLDISDDSDILITGGADNTARIWKVDTGKELHQFVTKNAVRAVAFSHYPMIQPRSSNDKVLVINDSTMGFPQLISVYPLAVDLFDQTIEPIFQVPAKTPKATRAIFGPDNSEVYTGHEDGSIKIWNIEETGELEKTVTIHNAAITDLQLSPDWLYFVSSSKDNTAKVVDTRSLNVLKKYSTDRPVNSASISGLKNHVILGGGQEAMEVTQTASREGKFEVRFFDKILQLEVGRVKGHFGPINTVIFHPSGNSFSSGSEDGYVRIHHFDSDYYNYNSEDYIDAPENLVLQES